MIGLLASGGCHKKTTEVRASAPEVAVGAQPDRASQNPAASAASAPTLTPLANNTPDLGAINRAYLGWIMRTHRHAKTFEEYVAAAGIQVSAPPAGQKYIIGSNGYIALVSK